MLGGVGCERGDAVGRPECVRAVVFDFDGTLCDTELKNVMLCQNVLHELGADVPLRELEVTLTGGDDLVTVPPLLEKHGAHGTIDDYERLRDHCYRTYAEADLALEPGARELLETLRGRGVRLGVASMTFSRCILTALNRLGVLRLFDAVVCGDMVARRKPDPEPYLTALGYLGVAPEDAVVFEDSPTGIAAGKAAGCHVVGYTGCAISQDVSAADEVTDTFVGLGL